MFRGRNGTCRIGMVVTRIVRLISIIQSSTQRLGIVSGGFDGASGDPMVWFINRAMQPEFGTLPAGMFPEQQNLVSSEWSNPHYLANHYSSALYAGG